MEKLIAQFAENDKFVGQFLVGNVSKGTNASGSIYLNVELRDSSGVINGKKWEVFTGDEELFQIGNILYIEGDTIKYKDALQVKILLAKPVDINDIDPTRFVKAPPVAKDELIRRFNEYVAMVKDEEYAKVIHFFIKKYETKLYDYPAGVSVHHEYASGLLMHVTSMCKLALFIADNYEDIDRDLLLTGCLLHDLGKLTELEGPAVYKYSLEGRLVGHISIMMGDIREAIHALNISKEKGILLEHMIISHHGQAEFGSPVMPLTKEALILSMVDNLDSKLAVITKAIEATPEGEFSGKIYPLDGRCFYKPKK